MARTLLILATHFIDEAVISEYRKMKNTPNVDTVLAIDNTNPKIEFKDRVENRIFFDTSVKCFFFESNLHDELKLPYFSYFHNVFYENFGDVMWNNCDYKLYYVRKFFQNYDYYWMMEYDVFCNAESYAGFLEKFVENRADLLINEFRVELNDGQWGWTRGLKWIYKNPQIYGGISAVWRLSARAIDFLYKRRLEHKEIFQHSSEQDKRWPGSEVFVPTELMNNGFHCENLNEERVHFKPDIYLNDERFFLQPDNHLYHPVKSIKTEISKLQAKYNELFFSFRKVFLTQFLDILTASSFVKNRLFRLQFDEKFYYVALSVDSDFNWWYEARFIQEKIYVGLVLRGKFLNDIGLLNKCIVSNKLQPIRLLKNPKSKTIAHEMSNLDDVSQVANAMKVLVESTYDVIQEKIL